MRSVEINSTPGSLTPQRDVLETLRPGAFRLRRVGALRVLIELLSESSIRGTAEAPLATFLLRDLRVPRPADTLRRDAAQARLSLSPAFTVS